MKSRLDEILFSLTAIQKNRLRKFLQSAYLNADDRLTHLAELLIREPDLRSDKKALHQRLFPGQRYDYHKISNLLSHLGRQLRQFLVFEELKTSPVEQELICLRAMRQGGLHESFALLHQQIGKELHRSEADDETHKLHAFHWLEEEDQWLMAKGERHQVSSLNRKIEALDDFYLLAMLKRACQWYNRTQILSGENPSPVLPTFVSWLELRTQKLHSDGLLWAYYLVLQTLTSEKHQQAYHQLKQVLTQQDSRLSTEERRNIYQYARNYCIRQSNRGQAGFLRELFETYQVMLQEEMLFHQGEISHGDVKNLVSLGLRLKEFAWTESFLQNIGPRISKDHRENAIRYNLAQLEHAQERFTQALRNLRLVSFEDVFYALGARTLLLKIYYSREEWEELLDGLKAFENWLRRNSDLNEQQRDGHLNFIKALKTLVLQHVQVTSDLKPEQIREQLQGFQPLSQKSWLLTQADKLQGLS